MATKPLALSKRTKDYQSSVRAVVSKVKSTTELRRLEAQAKAEEVKLQRAETRRIASEAKALKEIATHQYRATAVSKKLSKSKADEEAQKLEALKATATPGELRALGDVDRARSLEKRMKLQGMARAADRTVEVLEATIAGRPVPLSAFPSTKFEVMDFLKEKKWQTPLEFMLTIMNDTEALRDVRLDCAKASAPFVHAKLAAVQVEDTGTQVDSEIKELYRNALRTMADTGPPPPSVP
jgi:hypothetical protein